MSFWPAWLRKLVNPFSTKVTQLVQSSGPRRQVPARPAAPTTPATKGAHGATRSFTSVVSPGNYVVPKGLRPGWEWLPEHGAVPNLRSLPHWVRLWYATPWLDRHAYEWMWWHGGWAVLVPADPPEPPPDIGDRAPLRPTPTPRSSAARLAAGDRRN